MLGRFYSDSELYHRGIKGQKWGKRRYQYEDGTWTEEGKKRRRIGIRRQGGMDANVLREEINRIKLQREYNNLTSNALSNETLKTIQNGSKQITESANKVSNSFNNRSVEYDKYKQEVSHIPNEELQKRINRMNLEQQYARLAYNERHAASERGFQLTKDIVSTLGALVGIGVGGITIYKAIKGVSNG